MRQRQADSDDLLIKLVAAILLVAAGAWGYSRIRHEQESFRLSAFGAPNTVVSPSIYPPAAAAAPASALAERPLLPSPEPASASVINGKPLYYCTYRGTTSVQTQACVAPWTSSGDAGLPESDRDAEQRNRQLAEIKLAQAQADFASASGLDRTSQVFVQAGPTSVQRQSSRCEAAKQRREWALAQAGLNRTFDLIRRLNDEVYDACK